MNNHSDELKHYGVPGMKWGHRKSIYSRVTGSIRKRQMNNANNQLADIKSKQRQVNAELRELKGYEKNPSKIGSSKLASAIRRNQINKLNKTKNKLNDRSKMTKQTIDELNDIEKYAQKRDAAKAKAAEAKAELRVKDNDRRVKLYGKKNIMAADAANIAMTAYGTKVGMDIVKSIGVGTMKGIAQNPNIGNGALHAASVLTVAGMGAVAVSGLKRSYALGRDMKLTSQYDERQQYYKKSKKK